MPFPIPPTSLGYGHHWFIDAMKQFPAPNVLELGSRRREGCPSTLRHEWVPHAAQYIGTDFETGEDVDIVADLHHLSETFGDERFEGVIACSVLEHVQYPWIAVMEIARVMKQGGLIFIQTHHTYPLHGFPNDYWRFTEAGLATLFCPTAGFETISTVSDFKCQIVSERESYLKDEPAYLNVLLIARKTHTPTDRCFKLPD